LLVGFELSPALNGLPQERQEEGTQGTKKTR
jgi:hypothetical protein